MRIECCTPIGYSIRMVWHCEECRKLACKWVDLDTMQYREYVGPSGLLRTMQARTITWDQNIDVIFINPIDGVREENEGFMNAEELIAALQKVHPKAKVIAFSAEYDGRAEVIGVTYEAPWPDRADGLPNPYPNGRVDIET